MHDHMQEAPVTSLPGKNAGLGTTGVDQSHSVWQEWAALLGILRAASSLTVFSVPRQELSEFNATAIKSPTNTATVQGLKAGAIYVFQVRARTVAGYGRYSGKMYFQTMTEGEWCPAASRGAWTQQSLQDLLPIRHLCARQRRQPLFSCLSSIPRSQFKTSGQTAWPPTQTPFPVPCPRKYVDSSTPVTATRPPLFLRTLGSSALICMATL